MVQSDVVQYKGHCIFKNTWVFVSQRSQEMLKFASHASKMTLFFLLQSSITSPEDTSKPEQITVFNHEIIIKINDFRPYDVTR